MKDYFLITGSYCTFGKSLRTAAFYAKNNENICAEILGFLHEPFNYVERMGINNGFY